MTEGAVKIRLLNGFDDQHITPDIWNSLLENGNSDVVFLTWHWQKAWWDIFGRGKLLLLVAEKDDIPVAIAPLFEDGGMIFFTGSGGSDYLDFIGNINDIYILQSILEFAVATVTKFVGFRFYHIPEASSTPTKLEAVAAQAGWQFYDEGELAAPAMDLTNSEYVVEAINKKSLIRHESWFKNNGLLNVEHLSKSIDILPNLNAFFNQHINRWARTDFPSLFLDNTQQRFYQHLVNGSSETEWLRFTRVTWNNHPIAFHFGFNYKGNYLWYKPSFDIEFSKRSPGEVLLKQLFLHAVAEGAHTFDFGLGDEAFKSRFATKRIMVHTWGMYPDENTKG